MAESPTPTTPPREAPRRLFIAGTDTGVGKTEIATLLLRGMADLGVRALPYKPAQSGTDTPTDVERLAAASALDVAPADLVTHLYAPPLAPGIAHDPAPFTGSRGPHDPAPLRASLEHLRRLEREHAPAITLVEGAGGLLVPMPGGQWQPAWIAALSCPVLLVTRPDLGTLNHTHLTAEALSARGLPVVGLIINGVVDDDAAGPLDPSVPTNLEVLARVPGLPLLGCVPRVDPQRPDAERLGDLARSLAQAVWSRLPPVHA